MPITVYPWHQPQWQDILQRRAALPHALLFRGREGTGKLDFVRKLAQSLACESPAADGAACGTCQSCRWFAAGAHPDYREILPEALRPADPEGPAAGEKKPSQQISVDEIRALHDFINLTAHQPNGKTIVFCPAETLNVNAANALLRRVGPFMPAEDDFRPCRPIGETVRMTERSGGQRQRRGDLALSQRLGPSCQHGNHVGTGVRVLQLTGTRQRPLGQMF